MSVNAHRRQFAIIRSRRHETYINFNRKVVSPAGIDDIFQDELILGGERKKHLFSREDLEISQNMHDGGCKSSEYLLWFLAEQEPLVELGLAEAAADGAHGAVVRGAVIEPPELEELSLPCHVLSESFKTGPGREAETILPWFRVE